VPNVVGEQSAFAAEEKLVTAGLELDPTQRTRVDTKAAPGSVLAQTPKRGEEVEGGTPVSILVAVRAGREEVPDVVGMTLLDAERTLRDRELTLGRVSPPLVDLKAKIVSQLPEAGATAKPGTPVAIYYADPAT
jgi:serine/threonine-protein kinase